MSKQGSPPEAKRPEPSTTAFPSGESRYGARKSTALVSPDHVAKSDAAPETVEKLSAAAASPTSILIYSGAAGGTIDPNGALKPSIPVSATAGQVLVTDPLAVGTGGVVWSATAGKAAPVNDEPGDPTGTSSATPVMMGLGASAQITPASSGNILVTFDMLAVNATAADGFSASIAYDNNATVAAPGNGAAAVGIVVTPVRVVTATPNKVPISFTAVVPRLAVGATYWFDVQLAAVTGGTASITAVQVTLIEL